MFDFDGYPLASLNVWKYLKAGATAPLAVDSVPDISVSVNIGGEIKLPETINVIYNDRSENTQAAVTWDEAQLAAIDTSTSGNYEVSGTLSNGTVITGHVVIIMDNYVQNPGFEETNTSMWRVTYEGENNPTDFQEKTDDAHTGNLAFHFWSADSDM